MCFFGLLMEYVFWVFEGFSISFTDVFPGHFLGEFYLASRLFRRALLVGKLRPLQVAIC